MKIYIYIGIIFLFGIANNIAWGFQCIGNDYEQQTPIPNIKLPDVEIVNAPDDIKSGQIITLSAQVVKIQENEGQPFFYWCAEQGVLEYDPNSSDYSSVKFSPPTVNENTPVKIAVKMGDTLGYIDIELITVNIVSSYMNVETNKNTGDVLITSTDSTVDLTNQGTITLNDQPIQAHWIPDGVAFNLYEVTGKTFDTFWQPVKLEIHDVNGQEIYSGCYPFKDVCPNRWYTRPVMKLWKDGMIQGYNDGKYGIFGPDNPVRRAELVTATVRAKELDLTSAPLTTQPFADVSIDEWYAHYVQYAKDVGLIQGCDISKNLFCPNKQISRVAAAKVIALGLLKNEVDAIENGQTPLRLFNDVQNKDDWFYPYVYALQNAQAVHGYRDGSFGVGNDLNRAEMAKMICIAKFGSMECSDM